MLRSIDRLIQSRAACLESGRPYAFLASTKFRNGSAIARAARTDERTHRCAGIPSREEAESANHAAAQAASTKRKGRAGKMNLGWATERNPFTMLSVVGIQMR